MSTIAEMLADRTSAYADRTRIMDKFREDERIYRRNIDRLDSMINRLESDLWAKAKLEGVVPYSIGDRVLLIDYDDEIAVGIVTGYRLRKDPLDLSSVLAEVEYWSNRHMQKVTNLKCFAELESAE